MRIFSGIQPTGQKHLGNYIGAIRHYVDGQQRAAETSDTAIFCIVDLHATTVHYEPPALRRAVYDTHAILLAAGLDADRCVLFRQGDVQEHSELCWLLTAVTAHGDLNRMHQFKEKSAQQRELVSAGLFLYPVLQAADVLAYRADEVPVGDDQRQHIELMRDIAARFNARFGTDTLVVPTHRIPEVGARIMDLQQPTTKMSTSGTSGEGTIFVLDDADTIRRKFRRAVTDSEADVRYAPELKPGVSNLLEISAAVSGTTVEEAERRFKDLDGYGPLKEAVGEEVVEHLADVRARYAELRADERALERHLDAGASRARDIARATVADVRDVMGVGRWERG